MTNHKRLDRLEVVVVQRIIPTYRKPVFDALAARLRTVVLHTRLGGSIAQTTGAWSHPIGHWQYGKGETQVFLRLFGALHRLRPKVVIHEAAPGILSLPFTLLWCRLLGIKVALWGHGYNHKTGFDPKNRRSDRYRLWLMRRTDAIVLYGNQAYAVLQPYLPGKPIYVATNTLNTPVLYAKLEQLQTEGREAVRQRLGWGGGPHLIFTGRLLADKGVGDLVPVIQHLADKGMKATMHVVGDGPARGLLERQITDAGLADQFKLYGAIYDDERLGELLYASDAFVMPGYLGLNVSHALSFDCPVFSYEQGPNGPWHSPEAEHVLHGTTGFLVPAYQPQLLADALHHYLADARLQTEIRENISQYRSQRLSLAAMIDGMERCVRALSN